MVHGIIPAVLILITHRTPRAAQAIVLNERTQDQDPEGPAAKSERDKSEERARHPPPAPASPSPCAAPASAGLFFVSLLVRNPQALPEGRQLSHVWQGVALSRYYSLHRSSGAPHCSPGSPAPPPRQLQLHAARLRGEGRRRRGGRGASNFNRALTVGMVLFLRSLVTRTSPAWHAPTLPAEKKTN
jgi:hypothetical protein